jgi:hypothetical protein
MLSWFLSLPTVLIVLISVGIPVLVVLPVVRYISNSHLLPKEDVDLDGSRDALVALFGFLGTAFTLLLAFIIVNVQGEQAAAQGALFAETSALESVVKETNSFDASMSADVNRLIADYIPMMRDYEVDQIPPSGGDPRAEAAFNLITARFVKSDKQNSGEDARRVLDEVKSLTDARDARVDTPPGSLDAITTVICIFLALLTVVIMALLPAPRPWVKWVQSLGLAVAVGLVMSLVFYIASDAYTRGSEDDQFARIKTALSESNR